MKEDLFKINWDQIRKNTTRWILMNDHDLSRVDKTSIRSRKFVTMLDDYEKSGLGVEKYASIQGQEKNEIGKRLAQMEAEQNSILRLQNLPKRILQEVRP